MKLCDACDQLVAEEIIVCPACGSEVVEGRKTIDDYRILAVLHEGYSSVLCKAMQAGADHPVMIRIFTRQSGVDDAIAARLRLELERLKKLPEDYFVRHLEIKKSSDGLWYRVSEWIEAENWGTLLASGRLSDLNTIVGLFYRIASILEGLHQIGHVIPHLILNDIIVYERAPDKFEIKIDFKLSRFLDPALDRPGPMLQRLLNSHPDIVNRRPLDARSDIWSLGKAFVEILTADYEADDYTGIIDGLPLPDEIKALFKTMLANDPDLRPRSMNDITRVLSRFKDSKADPTPPFEQVRIRASTRLIKRIGIWISLLLAVVAVFVIGVLAWLYVAMQKGDSEAAFETFMDRYAASMAFVVTEYWLSEDGTVIYHSWSEGTAFLVDKRGYLMTNRHVACPWLEDANVNALIAQFEYLDRPIDFRYRIFLWFEGDRAFKRLPALSGSSDPADVYFLESAYRTDRTPSLTIAGVARLPVKTWQVVNSPLRDDFAILKIEAVPQGLRPLPLDVDVNTKKIRRLSPVIAIGFPLGSETQETTVNVSVTRGHVRRTFENLFQVDASIYRGNSGGPIVDKRGKVIGIASQVAVEMASAPLPVATRLSDIGMVLPIDKAAVFLKEIIGGEEKWDGVLDPAVDRKIEGIMRLARDRKLEEAEAVAQKELSTAREPALISAAGMISLGLEKHAEAASFFKRALAVDKQNDFLRFMLHLIAWLEDRQENSPHGEALRRLDWRSPFEFFGYLSRMMEAAGALVDSGQWYSPTEASWVHYLAGLDAEKKSDTIKAETAFKSALLEADADDWVYLLSLAGLDRVEKLKMKRGPATQEQAAYRDESNAFLKALHDKDAEDQKRNEKIAPLLATLVQPLTGIQEKVTVLEDWYALTPDNRDLLVWLAYYCAVDEKWEKALGYAQEYLQINGRENAGRLKLGLLEAQMRHFLGLEERTSASLEQLAATTTDPWYNKIVACLQGTLTETEVIEQSGGVLEYLLTAHTAFGFWAEGSGEKEQASRHYEEALGSYLDDKVEYEFARMRLRKMRPGSD